MKKRHLTPWVAGLLALLSDGLPSVRALNLQTQAEATHTYYNGSVVLDNGATASWTTSGHTVSLNLRVSGTDVQSVLDPENASPFWEFAGRSMLSSVLISDIGGAILSNQENGREGAGGYLRITTAGTSHMEWGRPEIPQEAEEYVYRTHSTNEYHLEAYGNAGPPMLNGSYDYYYRRYVATTPQFITNGHYGGTAGQPLEGDITEGIPIPGYSYLQISNVPVLFDTAPTLAIDARAHAAPQFSEAWTSYNEETGEDGYSYYVAGASLTEVNVSFTIELIAYDPSVQFTGFLDIRPNSYFPEETQVNMGDSWNWYELRIPGKIDMVSISGLGDTQPLLPTVLDKDRAFRGLIVNSIPEVVVDLSDHKITLGESATDTDLSTVGRESLLLRSGGLTLRNGDIEASRLVEIRNNGTANSTLTIEQGARLFVRDSSVDVGASAGARQAQVIVDGEGSLIETKNLYLGRHGHGATTVRNNGTLYVGEYIEMAAFADGDADLTVTGAGSSLELAPASPESIVFIGLGGRGAVTIEEGAAAKWNEGNILIGNDVSTSSGSLLVNGANTTSTGGDFAVAKTGQLRVANGASFQTATQEGKGLVVTGSASFESSSTGSLGMLRVESVGTADFEGGAKFTTNSAKVSSSGIITVSGTGTELTVTKMESGTEGLGQTLVQFGAKMTTGDIAFGQTVGASDYLYLAAGSFEHTGTQAKFGGGGVAGMIAQIGATMKWGHAEVTVATGSEFAVLNELTFSEGGNYKINGGSLQVGDQAIFSTENATGSGVTIRQGGQARFFGDASAAIGVLDIDNGSVNLETGASVSATSLTLNHGTLLVSGGSHLEFGTGTVANSTMTVGSTSEVRVQSLTVLGGGEVNGRGRIVGNVNNQGGIVRPGNSPGILEIDGDYTQEGGTLQLEIGGLAAGVDFDQLVVSGNLNILGGVIEFSFINGFAPTAGQTFSFFGVSGTFGNLATITVSGLESGWEFSTAFDAETGGFSMTSLNDGIAVIPEPSTIALAIGGLLAAMLLAKRHQAAQV